MKKLRRLKLKDANRMTDSEMKMIVGGYGAGEDMSPKEEACKGKERGDRCEFKYNGKTCYGTCQSFLLQPLHCSDLR